MEHKITIRKIEHINHNVLQITTDKPKAYEFSPGQATELSIHKDGLKNEKRPFTFTSLPEDKELEFVIKVYASHNGVTEKLEDLKVGDKLLIGDAWGAITYKSNGTFIAGGAGITPFIAILKNLLQNDAIEDNRLFFGNHKERDIIYKENLEAWLGENLQLALSEEDLEGYDYGYIDKEFLKKYDLNVSRPVYLCGPPEMMDSVKATLYEMGLPKSLLITEDS